MLIQNVKAALKQSRTVRRIYRKHLKPLRRQWEPEIYLLRDLHGIDVDTVIDIGANTGAYAVEFSRFASRVICFEPIPQCASEITELGLGNVDVVNAGLSDQSGSFTLNIPIRNGRLETEGSFIGGDEARGTAADYEQMLIEAISFDDYWRGAQQSRIDLIKIDVEGHELNTLRGAVDVIERYSPPLIVEIESRHNKDWQSVFAFLGERGYCVFYTPDAQILKSFAPSDLATLQKDFESRAYARGEVKKYINNFIFLPKTPCPVGDALRKRVE